ncbi:MAG: hypothetical protein LAN63_01900 [Acidobacteriia bacterium]|nr:hypothetical protein [Terriglobia bacterium]
MLNPRKALWFVAVLLMSSARLALAQGTYTQIDFPGAITTSCWGINNAGDIAGFYQDVGGVYHGFILSNGTYTTLDYPGAQATVLNRINDVGQIVGTADNFGFVYNTENQTFSEIRYPGADATFPFAINNAGTVVGFFTIQNLYSQGFQLIGSAYRAFAPANANTYVYGITNLGVIAGYVNSHAIHDFLFYHGKYRTLRIPNHTNAFVYGVNNAGNIFVGTFDNIGFAYQNNVVQTLRFPGGGLTYATGVNDAGEVVGLFLDSNLSQRGFTWTPPTDAAKK